MNEILESVFHIIVEYGILILEIVGAAIILIAGIKGIIGLLKRERSFKIELAEGIASALGFLLAGEALKTIIAPDWQEIGMTCAILLMRAAMSVLIHWEVSNEKKEISNQTAHTEE